MSFKKKILLSLSIFFSFLIIALMGIAFNAKDASFSSPANKASASNEEKVLVVPNEGKNPIKSSLDFVYEPHAMAASSTSATTKVYEFAFGNTGSQTMGVDLYTRLSEMVGDGQDLNVNVSYATSATRLTSFTDNTTSSYSISKIERGNTQYAYVILSVIDKTKPVDFTTSLDWVYGKPIDITCYIKDDSVGLDYQEELTLIASTNIYESLTKINVRGGYGVLAYYSNEEKTDEIDLNTLVYDGIKVYFKLDTTGEFNPYNNPRWFALMGPDADGDGKDDVQKYYNTELAGVDFYYYRNFLTSKADVSPYYFQVIHGNTTIKVATEDNDYESLDKLGQLIVPAQYTLKNTSLTIPVKKIESLEVYSIVNDPNPIAVFSGQKQITSIVISEGIETIGYGCFNECDSLRYIEIPSSVTYVNRMAFQYCDNLEEVKFIPRTDDTEVVLDKIVFNQNPKLSKITLPNNLKNIDNNCFYKNPNLRTIDIPNSVTSIGINAFQGCSVLTSLYFEEGTNITSIGQQAFYQCGNLTSIGSFAYSSDNYVDESTRQTSTYGFDMTYMGDLELIAHAAFAQSGLNKVVIPSTVSSLSGGNSPESSGKVFQECTKLVEVEFKSNTRLDVIPIQTFQYCASLQVVKQIPLVSTICAWAFDKCASLHTITTVDDATQYVVNVPGTDIGKQAFSSCTKLTKVVLIGTPENILQNTFASCEKLETVDFGTATPEMIDRFAFAHCDALKYSLINGTHYNYFKIPEGVKFIGHGAFYDSLGLVDVELPSTLVQSFEGSADGETNYGIDSFAFQACLNLKTVTLHGSSASGSLQTLASSVFNGCTNLEKVVIPNNIKTLGNNLFNGCKKITQITNDSSVSNGVIILSGTNDLVINQQSFANCTGLQSINFGRIQTIGNRAFQGCAGLTTITLPKTVTSIGAYAFQDCTALTTLTYANDTPLTAVSENMFQGCTSLTTVNIPATIKTIGPCAFFNCYKFNQASITANVTTIRNNAFWNCYALESVDLTKVTTIEKRAFTYSGIKSLTLPSNVTFVGDWAFAYCDALTSVDFYQCSGDVFSGSNIFNSCKSLTSVTISENINSLGNNMFSGCSNLRDVTFEEGCQLTTIATNAFRNTAITTILLPDSVTTIGTWAFANCTSLVSIQMDYVTVIDHQAFSGCSSLANTIIEGETQQGFITTDRLQSIGFGSFHKCSSLKTLELGTGLKTIKGHSFLASGLTSAKFRTGNHSWKLYKTSEGTPTATSYGTITITSDGAKYKYGSSSEISLVVGLTSITTSIPNQGGVYAVYLYWEKQ